MRRRRLRFVAFLVVVFWITLAPGSAAAFGTIDSGGQNREHERIARAALACAGDADLDIGCFEPRAMDYLAGHDREFGAVGAPDSDELSDPAAHCKNVVSQCDNLLLMRMNSEADLIDLGRLFSFVPPGLVAGATSFRMGQALVAGRVLPRAGYVQMGVRVSEEGGTDVPAAWAAPRSS